jgi:hypothetical protein
VDKNARKGKLPERVGRKATGLKPGGWKGSRATGREPVVAKSFDAAMGSTSVECVSVGFGRISTEVLQ